MKFPVAVILAAPALVAIGWYLGQSTAQEAPVEQTIQEAHPVPATSVAPIVEKQNEIAETQAEEVTPVAATEISPLPIPEPAVQEESAGEFVISSDPRELGRSGAQMVKRLRAFNDLYGETAPSMDEDGYIEYAATLDELMQEVVPLALGIQEYAKNNRNPESIADFQTTLIQEAIELDQMRAENLKPFLEYANSYVREIGLDKPPASADDQTMQNWHEARASLANEFNAQLELMIPQDKFAEFQSLFGPEFIYGVGFGLNLPEPE